MTTFYLKIVALVFMVIDHIGLFFPDTPIYLRWIGRMSAPIFVFCVVQGMLHTKNKKKYLLRLYLSGVVMSIIDYILNGFANAGIGSVNIFVTLFSTALIIYLIELIRSKNPKAKTYLIVYCIWQTISTIILCQIERRYDDLVCLFMGVLGNVFYNEGKFIFVILGVIIYLANNKKTKIALYYSSFCILYSFIIITNIIPRIMTRLNYYDFDVLYNLLSLVFPLLGFKNYIFIRNVSILYKDFEWMMLGSLPFMLMYNGKRGKSLKYFFYVFYPLHIVILFGLSKL